MAEHGHGEAAQHKPSSSGGKGGKGMVRGLVEGMSDEFISGFLVKPALDVTEGFSEFAPGHRSGGDH